MRKIIRSLLWLKDIEKTEATSNVLNTKIERLVSLEKAERVIVEHILDFYFHYQVAPGGRATYTHFENQNAVNEAGLIEQCLTEHFLSLADYEQALETEIENQAAYRISELCKRVMRVATVGESDGKGNVLKGVDVAVDLLLSEAQGKPSAKEGYLPSHMRKASSGLTKLYQDRQNNPLRSKGVLTGFNLIDQSTAGIRKKQLYLHAGFGGHLKSTCILNMMVNAAVQGKWNSLLFSSEMPASDVMLMIIAIHSMDPKFQTTNNKPINTFKLLLGGLDPVAVSFFENVKDDLVNNSNYGSIRVVDSGEFTGFSSVAQRTLREHREEPVDMLWIDYLTRLPLDPKYNKMDYTTARNETIVEAKRFAMAFEKGEGLAVGSAFQINREGYKRARDNGGKCDKTALAQFNAAEREADVISYIFFGADEAAICEPKLGMMKSRWGPVPPEPVSLFLDPDSRRMFDLTQPATAPGALPTHSLSPIATAPTIAKTPTQGPIDLVTI